MKLRYGKSCGNGSEMTEVWETLHSPKRISDDEISGTGLASLMRCFSVGKLFYWVNLSVLGFCEGLVQGSRSGSL